MSAIDEIRARDAAVEGKRRTQAERDRSVLLAVLDSAERERTSLMRQLEEASHRNAADRDAFLAWRAERGIQEA